MTLVLILFVLGTILMICSAVALTSLNPHRVPHGEMVGAKPAPLRNTRVTVRVRTTDLSM
jgi:hypothetical protein